MDANGLKFRSRRLAESFSGAMKGIQQVIGMSAILLWSYRFRNLDVPIIFRSIQIFDLVVPRIDGE